MVLGTRGVRLSTEFPVRPTAPVKRGLPVFGGRGGATVDEAALLASIVRDSNDAIISKTLEGIITSWNHGAERLFGYSAQEAVGEHIALIIPDERRREEEFILERLSSGERLEHFETVRRRRDGGLIDVSLTVSPVRDIHGDVVGASKIARDIRDRKKYEKALQELDRRKNEFLAILSHELRGPLASLATTPALLRATPARPEEAAALADLLERQVAQLKHLVDDLLDVSRIGAGKIVLHLAPVAMADVVATAVRQNQAFIDSQGLGLRVASSEDRGFVSGDPHRLVQICSNLLHNAAKYTDAGGHIAVSVGREGPAVILRVRDTGIGIAADSLDSIFGLYVQADEARRKAPGGLGVGLAITRRLVELHGGTIEATSDGVGRGAEFVVRLPALDGAGQPDGTARH